MKRLIPILQAMGPKVRSSSMKHLETFMSALMVYIGLLGWPTMSESIISALGRIYHLAHAKLMGSATTLISELKSAQIWYLSVIRGSSMDGAQRFDHPNDFFAASKGGKLLGNTILGLRSLVAVSMPHNLLAYDRIVWAFLSLHRLIITEPNTDFSTITSPSTFVPGSEGSISEEELLAALSALGIDPEEFRKEYVRRCREQTHILLSTAGPNGKATWTAYSDAIALMNSPEVLRYIVSFAEQSRLTRFLDDMFNTVSLPGQDVSGGERLQTAKIHTFEEWGGKTRHVAIVDYWTQLLLTPLHDTLFHYLRNIEMDGTFDQDSACDAIRRFTATDGFEVFSVDLSAATDRLPVHLQVQILTALTGNHTLADAWAKLFTERKFFTIEKTYIQYGAGLPMGSKSNWALLALTHHIIIQVAARRAKVGDYTLYRVVGDDSTMVGNEIQVRYRAIMAVYGLTINDSKSVLHTPGLLSAAEFCKRIFVNGNEITSIPVKLIVKTAMNGRLAPQLQNELTRRGSAVPSNIFYQFITALVDRESLEFLMVLNVLPRSLSGLVASIIPDGPIADIARWYGSKHTVTPNTLRNAYTFVVVTEQLKRLDTLLRQTDIINQAIEEKAIGYMGPSLDAEITTPKGERRRLVEYIGLRVPELSPSHPVCGAAYVESTRIAALLSSLRSGQSDVSTVAMSKLLDGFRNALVDAWDDKVAARAQADRTLVVRAMEALGRIVNMPTMDKGNNPLSRRLDFTVTLAYVGKMWSVQWVLGQDVRINSIKSRVISTPSIASETYIAVQKSPRILSRFGVDPKSDK